MMIQMRKLLISIGLLLLSGLSLMAQEQEQVWAEFEQQLASKSQQVQTIACRFVQVRSLAVLASEVRKAGDFRYAHPERMLLQFDDGDYIRMDATTFRMQSAGHVTRTRINANPMLKELKRMLTACMTGDIRQITVGFDVAVTSDKSGYVMTLVPQRGRSAARVSRMVLMFDKGDMTLKRLRMEQPSGDSTEYQFMEKTLNEPIEEGLFATE